MLRYGIPSYKLEKDLLAAEIDVIRKLGVEIRCGVEDRKRYHDRRTCGNRVIKVSTWRWEDRPAVEGKPG